ncbi:uncharacterized protein LOC144616372 [Panthera onca]
MLETGPSFWQFSHLGEDELQLMSVTWYNEPSVARAPGFTKETGNPDSYEKFPYTGIPSEILWVWYETTAIKQTPVAQHGEKPTIEPTSPDVVTFLRGRSLSRHSFRF